MGRFFNMGMTFQMLSWVFSFFGATGDAAPAVKAPAPKPKDGTPKRASPAAASVTPGTGRARREAKRTQDAMAECDPKDFSLAFRQDDDAGKVTVAWTHRSCRPGDVDAWVGLHEVLAPARPADDEEEEEVRHAVGTHAVSGRRRYKGIRSNKLEGEMAFPLVSLEDGEYILALHNARGTIGDENLFLAVSEVFTVRNNQIRAADGNKRPKQ